MGRSIYAQLPANLQKAISTTAGIVLSDFDPANPGTKEAIKQKIQFATTGGVTVTCKAELKDYGEGIDNCPADTKELLDIVKYECMLSGTAVTIKKEDLVERIGTATLATEEGGHVSCQPNYNISVASFAPKWYVCPYGHEGGFVAIKLDNAYSTGGLSLQSEDKGKGQYAFEYKAFSSIDAPDVVPFTIYLKETDVAQVSEVGL